MLSLSHSECCFNLFCLNFAWFGNGAICSLSLTGLLITVFEIGNLKRSNQLCSANFLSNHLESYMCAPYKTLGSIPRSEGKGEGREKKGKERKGGWKMKRQELDTEDYGCGG